MAYIDYDVYNYDDEMIVRIRIELDDVGADVFVTAAAMTVRTVYVKHDNFFH